MNFLLVTFFIFLSFSGQTTEKKIVDFKFDNGDTFSGQIKNSKINGHGKYQWASGDIYIGEWVNGSRTGQGNFIWANGDQYIGQFFEGSKEGFGIFKYKDTKGNISKYSGYYKKNKKNGDGVFYKELKSMQVYFKWEGTWVQDKFISGIMQVYENDNLTTQLEGRFDGESKLIKGTKKNIIDGIVTEGQFDENIELNGYGKISNKSMISEGNFYNGVPVGLHIVESLIDGGKVLMQYKDGKIVKETMRYLELPDDIKKQRAEINQMRQELEQEKRNYHSRKDKVARLMDFSAQLLQTGKYAKKPVQNTQPKFLMKTCFLNGSSIHQSQIEFHCM